MVFIFPARGRLLICFIIFFVLSGFIEGYASTNPRPQFNGPLQQENNAGQIKLIWCIEDSLLASDKLFMFELQQSHGVAFETNRTLYKGSDLASFVSGLPDGDYYYRVRTFEENGSAGEWSETLHLKVRHQSLSLAFTLFGLGAVVFISTVVLILYGNKKAEKEV